MQEEILDSNKWYIKQNYEGVSLKESNYQINNSNNINNLKETSKEQHQEQITYYQQELQILGNQLIEERRKSKEIQEKIFNYKSKNINLKKKAIHYKKQLISYLQIFQVLSDNINNNSNLLIDANKKQLKIIYKTDEFINKFTQFIYAIQNTLTEHSNIKLQDEKLFQSTKTQNNSYLYSSSKYQAGKKIGNLTIDTSPQMKINPIMVFSPTNSEANGHIFNRINDFMIQKDQQKEICSLKRSLQEKVMQIQNLKRVIKQKDEMIKQAKERMTELNEQIYFVEARNSQMFKQLQENEQKMNELREVQEKSKIQLKKKEGTIAHYQKILKNQKLQIQQKKNLEKSVLNYERIIQENKEELCNLNEVIERYKEQHGQLKNIKNREIQLQIKDYIRQLDQIGQFDEQTHQDTILIENAHSKKVIDM